MKSQECEECSPLPGCCSLLGHAVTGPASRIKAGLTAAGRRERVPPLWKETAVVIKAWLKIRPAGEP